MNVVNHQVAFGAQQRTLENPASDDRPMTNLLELGSKREGERSDDPALAVGVLEEREAELMRAELALQFVDVTNMTVCLLCGYNMMSLA